MGKEREDVMSQQRIVALVLDDEGEEHWVSCYYGEGEDPYEVVEQESLERGIRYVDATSLFFPNRGAV